jgi:hypothetical protein
MTALGQEITIWKCAAPHSPRHGEADGTLSKYAIGIDEQPIGERNHKDQTSRSASIAPSRRAAGVGQRPGIGSLLCQPYSSTQSQRL